MLNTAILLIVFNRIETTRQVFEVIRKVRPKQLFIAADGPRPDKEGEVEKCEAVRKIATNIDWECNVKTLFRNNNLGCGRGPSEAITWFFENVDQGIILEDDCLPDLSFFKFCDELLIKYQDNNEIVIISGFNTLGTFEAVEADYFFSKVGGIWGWASWRRAWKLYKFNVPEWKEANIRNRVLSSLPSDKDRLDMKHHLNKIISGERNDFWDFQWWFYRMMQGGMAIIPKHNLISNIGFGIDASHTLDSSNPISAIKSKTIKFPFLHPISIEENKEYEIQFIKFSQRANGFRSKNLISKLKNIIKLGFSINDYTIGRRN